MYPAYCAHTASRSVSTVIFGSTLIVKFAGMPPRAVMKTVTWGMPERMTWTGGSALAVFFLLTSTYKVGGRKKMETRTKE